MYGEHKRRLKLHTTQPDLGSGVSAPSNVALPIVWPPCTDRSNRQEWPSYNKERLVLVPEGRITERTCEGVVNHFNCATCVNGKIEYRCCSYRKGKGLPR